MQGKLILVRISASTLSFCNMIDVHTYDTGLYCDDRIFDCLTNLTVQTFVHTEPFNIFALGTD